MVYFGTQMADAAFIQGLKVFFNRKVIHSTKPLT